MKIHKIRLENFRNVINKEYALDPNFTVFIGINGQGKSTWLHALRIACGAYLLGIPEAKSRHIAPDEIRRVDTGSHLKLQFPVVIEAQGSFPESDKPITWRRRILENSNKTTSSNEDVGNIRDLGKKKYLQPSDQLDLPVIAFFGTSRVYGANRDKKAATDSRGREIFKEGYNNWYEMRSSTYHYDMWLTLYDSWLKRGHAHQGNKEAFFEAIKKANPYIQEISWNGQELMLRVNINDNGNPTDELPIHLHSDGIIQFTEMVAELAFRCIVLNGYKGTESVSGTQGIVMIDELDLHLHPVWQRRVVQDLKNAFPNIQFVATTHSPFIVQSLESGELINLDAPYHTLEKAPYHYGIEDIAEIEMGVADVSRSEAFKQRVDIASRYFELVQQGKTNLNDVEVARLQAQLNDLEERFTDDPTFVAYLRAERKLNQL